MNVLDHFSIPYKGLASGIHNLHFQVDTDFFRAFDNALITNGSFKVDLLLDKRSDHSIMSFHIAGDTETTCDRCLEDMQLPVEGEYTLHLKFSELESEDDEVVFLHPETSIVNVARYIYDIIGLSMPISKTCDMQLKDNAGCNELMLQKMTGDQVEEKESEQSEQSSPWDGLKGLKFDN